MLISLKSSKGILLYVGSLAINLCLFVCLLSLSIVVNSSNVTYNDKLTLYTLTSVCIFSIHFLSLKIKMMMIHYLTLVGKAQ